MGKLAKSGVYVGLNKGFIVTKLKQATDKQKHQASYRKGRLHPRVAAVRSVVNEICGQAPYERKMMEMIKTGNQRKEKNSVKLARKRLGSQRRASTRRNRSSLLSSPRERDKPRRPSDLHNLMLSLSESNEQRQLRTVNAHIAHQPL